MPRQVRNCSLPSWTGACCRASPPAPHASLLTWRQVAGGAGESVVLPQWGPDGALYFVTDAPDGWWNLHVMAPGGGGGGVSPCWLRLLLIGFS